MNNKKSRKIRGGANNTRKNSNTRRNTSSHTRSTAKANKNKNKTSPKANNKPAVKLRVGGLVFLPASLSKGTSNKTGVSGFESLLQHWDKYSTTGVSKIIKIRRKTVDGKSVPDKLGLYIYNSGQFIIKDPEQVRPLTEEERKRLYTKSRASKLSQPNLDSFESTLLTNA